jgi:hypothetical protein
MQMKKRIFVSIVGQLSSAVVLSLIWIPLSLGAFAQEPAQDLEHPATARAAVVPQQVRYAGKLSVRAGQTVQAEFRIYSAQEGGEPLWTETQQFPIAADGSYSVLLGNATAAGLPQSVFAGGAARWLGVSVERAPESERVLLSSVPYAMKSADAESLSGHAASDFVTQEQLAALAPQGSLPAATESTDQSTPTVFHGLTSGPLTGSGTANTIPLWTGTLTQGNSVMTQNSGTVDVQGPLAMPPVSQATTANGQQSEPIQMNASAWNTVDAASDNQTYSWVVGANGNNTATPSGTLYLQYQSGTGPKTNILRFLNTGQIAFAPTQTFPGTLASVTGVGSINTSTSAGAVTVALNVPTLELQLNGTYPRLSVANTFTGNQSITGGLTVTGALSAGSSLVTGLSSSTGGFLSNSAVTLKPASLATSGAAVNSPLLEVGASAYSSSSAAALAQNFAWQTDATGNNTISPSANLALLFGSGTSAPTATGLSIAPNGNITFAPSQTFPGGPGSGTITGITTSSPLTGSGTTGSVAIGLNQSALVTDITPSLETTLNGVYAQLAANNTFTAPLQNLFDTQLAAYGSTGSNYAALYGFGSSGTAGTYGNSDTYFGLWGRTTTPANGVSGVMGDSSTSASGTYLGLGNSEANEVAGVWGDTTGNPNTTGGGSSIAYWAAGVLGTADDANAGAFFNNSGGSFYTLYAKDLGNGSAIGGSASVGDGVNGFSDNGNGVYGATTFGAGVLGQSSSGDGVAGTSSSGAGIYGTSASNYGAEGLSSSSNGVFGQSSGTGSAATGLSGVYGLTLAPALGNAGVFGDAYGTSYTYSYVASFDFVSGVWADSAAVSDGSTNQTAGLVATADDSEAALIFNDSSTYETVQIANLGAAGTGLFSTMMLSTPDGTCGFGRAGTMTCTGQIKTLATTGGGAHTLETYAPQSAENWMEDYGTGSMNMGVAVVKIDPAFAETVSETSDYHVFLTPNADSRGLYVINRTPTSFEVRESGGGTSSLTFDYKIVAKRRGYEKQRLVDVTERFNDEQARSLLGRGHGAPIPAAAPPRIAAAHPFRVPARNGVGPNGVRAKATRATSPVRHARPAGSRVSVEGPTTPARP